MLPSLDRHERTQSTVRGAVDSSPRFDRAFQRPNWHKQSAAESDSWSSQFQKVSHPSTLIPARRLLTLDPGNGLLELAVCFSTFSASPRSFHNPKHSRSQPHGRQRCAVSCRRMVKRWFHAGDAVKSFCSFCGRDRPRTSVQFLLAITQSGEAIIGHRTSTTGPILPNPIQ